MSSGSIRDWHGSSARARILIIDDEVEIRESLEALLTSEGYDVELAQNAAEGERHLESRAWDLVLLDLMMPDKSGMEVLREVRERDRHTPIFMITAWGGANSHMAIRAGELDLPAVIGAGEVLYRRWSAASRLNLDCAGRRVEALA